MKHPAAARTYAILQNNPMYQKITVVLQRVGLDHFLLARAQGQLDSRRYHQGTGAHEPARQVYFDFGKGRPPAGLNLADCFAHALAKATGEPLLFKGEDFAKTDVRAARS